MENLVLPAERIDAILLESAHVRGEIMFLEQLAAPGMTVVDIGGNKGLTAIRLARAVAPGGRVHAFEPVPEYCEALRKNVALHGLPNVVCCNCALGNREGATPYFRHGEGSGIVPEDGAERIEVAAVTLDAYVATEGIGKIGLMSMDCEGSELYVFQGAENVLRRFQPRIFCEIHHGYLAKLGLSAEDVAKYLEARGYEVLPVFVEAPDSAATLDNCSHIRALPR